MKKLITLILLGLMLSLSTAVFADELSTLRVVVVDTDDAGAYIAQLNKGSLLIKAIAPKMTIRAWRATFAGDSTGAMIVALEYPGSLADFATAWDKVQADKSVAQWLAGLAELRKIVSDSLYSEIEI
ncbi:hypothetical protein [Paraglaciecola sp. MB-3u-78]|jgi:hypothetical protein|uniref:hypothetical protein n=1 Tax=Paraglaciecola sp. MB-3u-78 TaxID=2058332 RepID=UPI000C337F6E|nr:hypothetical protein [Paraglaciecola sp. MB-3u-78]PKG97735.1 hypothetical protein CXF95_14880 [Paraglaciecola sp. MB-3u-78]